MKPGNAGRSTGYRVRLSQKMFFLFTQYTENFTFILKEQIHF